MTTARFGCNAPTQMLGPVARCNERVESKVTPFRCHGKQKEEKKKRKKEKRMGKKGEWQNIGLPRHFPLSYSMAKSYLSQSDTRCGCPSGHQRDKSFHSNSCFQNSEASPEERQSAKEQSLMATRPSSTVAHLRFPCILSNKRRLYQRRHSQSVICRGHYRQCIRDGTEFRHPAGGCKNDGG